MITSEYTLKLTHDERIGPETVKETLMSILGSYMRNVRGIDMSTLRTEYVEPETIYSLAVFADANGVRVTIPISVVGDPEAITIDDKRAKLNELDVIGLPDLDSVDIEDVPKAVYDSAMEDLHWRDPRFINSPNTGTKKFYKFVLNSESEAGFKYLVTTKDLSFEKIAGYACRLGKASDVTDISNVVEIDKVEYYGMKWGIENLGLLENRASYTIKYADTEDADADVQTITFRTQWNFPELSQVFDHAVRMNKIPEDNFLISVEESSED